MSLKIMQLKKRFLEQVSDKQRAEMLHDKILVKSVNNLLLEMDFKNLIDTLLFENRADLIDNGYIKVSKEINTKDLLITVSGSLNCNDATSLFFKEIINTIETRKEKNEDLSSELFHFNRKLKYNCLTFSDKLLNEKIKKACDDLEMDFENRSECYIISFKEEDYRRL